MRFAKAVLQLFLQEADNWFLRKKQISDKRNYHKIWMLQKRYRKRLYSTKKYPFKMLQNKRRMGKSEVSNEVRSGRKGMEKRNLVIFPENGVKNVLKQIYSP